MADSLPAARSRSAMHTFFSSHSLMPTTSRHAGTHSQGGIAKQERVTGLISGSWEQAGHLGVLELVIRLRED